MHWLMLLSELWVSFGILTVIVGLLWTNKAARDADQAAAEKPLRSGQRTDFATPNFSEVRSA